MSNQALKNIPSSNVCKSVPDIIRLSVENHKLFNKLVFLFNIMKNDILIEWDKIELLDVDIHVIKQELLNNIMFTTTTQVVICPLPSIIFTKATMLSVMTRVYNIQSLNRMTPEAEFLHNLIMEMMCMIYNNVKLPSDKMRYFNEMNKKYTEKYKINKIVQEMKTYHNHT